MRNLPGGGVDISAFTDTRAAKMLNFRTAEFSEASKGKYCMAKVGRPSGDYHDFTVTTGRAVLRVPAFLIKLRAPVVSLYRDSYNDDRALFFRCGL